MSKAFKDPRILRGMEAQLKLRRERLETGETPLGWKIGFGTTAAKEQLDTDMPLVGFMTNKAILPSGATVSLAGWTKAVAEPEIAVYMGQDLAEGADRETTQAAIASIAPAIELADLSFPPNDVEPILAGNIFHRHVILGEADTSRAGGVLDGIVGRAYRDGTEVAATSDPQAVTGDLIDNVQHVANLLAIFGEKLRAGEVIITGSIVAPLLITANEEISYTLDPLGKLSINIAG